MPNKDKTGPGGKGPRTGRGKGNCVPPKKSNPNPSHDKKDKGKAK